MRTISDRRNLIIKVYVIGYPQRGESICILFLDSGYDNKVLYSIVIDCFKYKGINKTIEILDEWGIKKDKDKLDMLVWSHPDYDHTYGIDAVLYNCCDEKTKVILPYDLNGEAWNKIDYNRDDKEIVEKILGLTKRKFLSHETACVPQNLYIPFENMVFNDLLGDLHADIFAISPHSARINYLLETHSEIHKNDLSIGLCIDVGNEYKYRLVFLSDIENEAIHMLYNKSYEDPVFIKIPHHTSSTSDHYLECISNLDEKPYIACTTTYKTQKLPEKDLLAGYISQVQQVDCTGFSKNKNQNFGFIEYTFDFYKDNTITVNHEGHARIVNDDFLNSIRYHKKKNKI